jgi:hypothetical protein
MTERLRVEDRRIEHHDPANQPGEGRCDRERDGAHHAVAAQDDALDLRVLRHPDHVGFEVLERYLVRDVALAVAAEIEGDDAPTSRQVIDLRSEERTVPDRAVDEHHGRAT